MKKVLRWGVIALLASSAWAQAPQRRHVRREAPKPATAEELQELKDALAAQQQQIQQLREEIRQRDEAWQKAQQQLIQLQTATTETQNKLAAVESTAQAQRTVVNKLQSNVADVQTSLTSTAASTQEEQKKMSALAGVLGRFRWNGDIRVRYENFSQTGLPMRNRERIRLRLGVEGALNQDFIAGMYVASGAITDPTSTNETLTNVFERKTIAFDRGWITYAPQTHKWLSLTAGKWSANWQKTNMTFDADLNPEGFSEKLSFDIENDVLKNVTFNGIQLFYNEASKGPDSFAAGGQMLAKLALGKSVVLTPSYTALNWRNKDVILNEPASVIGSTGISCSLVNNSPACSFPNGVFAPNGMTNATVTVDGQRQFLSNFLYSDLILDTAIKTGIDRFPLRIVAEYENNLRAATNASHMYVGDMSIGHLKERGDFLFGYGFWRVEQDAVIASFAESDQRAPTNIIQHRLYGQYNVKKNVAASYTLWVGRTLNSSLQNAVLAPGVLPGQTESYLKRMQFDLIYKF